MPRGAIRFSPMDGVSRRTIFWMCAVALPGLVLAGGCRGTSAKHTEGAQEPRPAADSKVPPTPGLLPGPPDSATAPRSKDPGVREVEDRLFQTDGGRVVLKAIRTHGGWEHWREVTGITALVRARKDGAQKDGPQKDSTERRLTYAPGRSEGSPGEIQVLTAPFSLADPAFRFDYQGVEVDAEAGDTFDKVQVARPTQNGEWLLVYVSRRTGLVSRLLLPRKSEGEPPGRGLFDRIDLSRQREAGGVLLSTIWTRFALRNRLARADLAHPTAVEELELQVTIR
jgi:hypothetical protein